ncbi:MAG: GNAT family N-acetyltransferase [Rickettsiales bacterium]
MKITKTIITRELRDFIVDGFIEHDIQTLGYSGRDQEQTAFTIKVDNEIAGVTCLLPFWGGLWVKILFVQEKFRKQGIARKLMEQAFIFAKEQNCDFAFVETMSFQAPEFYQKLGFELEYSRGGYAEGSKIHYLRKILK